MKCAARYFVLFAAGFAAASVRSEEDGELTSLLTTIQSVAPKGKGNREAAQAWRGLVVLDAAALPPILTALDEANPIAANWLRSAAETIADRQLSRNGALPHKELEEFLLDTRHQPRGRRLAFELLTRSDPTAPERLVPRMLHDPAPEFRRDAVQRLYDEAARLEEARRLDDAERIYLHALEGALEPDQTEAIAGSLERLGRPIDLAKHFGFVLNWNLIGPFDNAGGKGFDSAYPPETLIELSANHAGKTGDVRWASVVSDDRYGVVNLAKALGPHKGAVGYAAAEFALDAKGKVELRMGTPNAVKLWVNGKPAFQRDEYHRGMEPVIEGGRTVLKPVLDQFRIPVELPAGKSVFLIKVCQNEQTEDWAQLWQFQLRVCDGDGTGILSTTRPP
jgi:hypothetical protein